MSNKETAVMKGNQVAISWNKKKARSKLGREAGRRKM